MGVSAPHRTHVPAYAALLYTRLTDPCHRGDDAVWPLPRRMARDVLHKLHGFLARHPQDMEPRNTPFGLPAKPQMGVTALEAYHTGIPVGAIQPGGGWRTRWANERGFLRTILLLFADGE